jgi:hypothetical protein
VIKAIDDRLYVLLHQPKVIDHASVI